MRDYAASELTAARRRRSPPTGKPSEERTTFAGNRRRCLPAGAIRRNRSGAANYSRTYRGCKSPWEAVCGRIPSCSKGRRPGPFNSSMYRTAGDSGSSSRGHPRHTPRTVLPVIPAKAGIQYPWTLDSGVRRSDAASSIERPWVGGDLVGHRGVCGLGSSRGGRSNRR